MMGNPTRERVSRRIERAESAILDATILWKKNRRPRTLHLRDLTKSENRRNGVARLSSFFEARNGEQTEVTLPGV